MIVRVRSRLLLLAAALSLLAAITYRGVLRADGFTWDPAGELLFVIAGVFGISLFSAWIALALARSYIRELVDTTHNIARDPARRVPVDTTAPKGDEVRELGEWVNFLAEDAARSHEALAHEKALLAAVAEGLNQGVIAVDAEHRIELLNAAARKMLRVASTPVGEPLVEFMRVPEAFELIRSSEAGQAEVQLPNGPRVLIRTAHKWGGEGEGRVLLLEDVTAMRRLETVRRDFVANVSHELRTPVAVIRANAETLLAGAKDDPAIAPKLLQALHRNAERLAALVGDLLDLSRLEAGHFRLDIAPVPVRATVTRTIELVEILASSRGVTVENAIPDDLSVLADPRALEQICTNLVDNAIKYAQADGTVEVASRDEGEMIRIEVRDDGAGIPEKHRARVFERFYRADSSRSRDAGGTGLGLSIVKHLVERMGGSVGVEPNTPRGTIFWLRLPRSPG